MTVRGVRVSGVLSYGVICLGRWCSFPSPSCVDLGLMSKIGWHFKWGQAHDSSLHVAEAVGMDKDGEIGLSFSATDACAARRPRAARGYEKVHHPFSRLGAQLASRFSHFCHFWTCFVRAICYNVDLCSASERGEKLRKHRPKMRWGRLVVALRATVTSVP